MCAKFFYILIVLMAGLFPFKMQASETKQTFILYTPYTKISVPPGESISYSIDVINNSDEVKNATLALAGLPKSWSYEMKAGGWTLDEIAVLPGEKKNFTLKVDVPLKVNKGTYHFTIGADGLARLPLAITVSKQGTYRTEFTTTQPNMQGIDECANIGQIPNLEKLVATIRSREISACLVMESPACRHSSHCQAA